MDAGITRNATMCRLFTAVLLCAGIAAAPMPEYPLRDEGVTGYQHFVGVTSADKIPPILFTLSSDQYFDQFTYAVGAHSSLLKLVQSSSGISKSVFHDQTYAEQVDENGAVSRDSGARLKDMVTQEALISGRIAFDKPVQESLRAARIVVPGGWPVDLTFTPGGRLWRATIHGTEDTDFVPLSFDKVQDVNVVSNWLIGKRHFSAASVGVASSQELSAPRTGPGWEWLPEAKSWKQPFAPYDFRPTLPIAVNGIKGTCIVDTGTAGLFLSSALAAQAGVRQIGIARVARSSGQGSGGYGRADFTAGPARLRSAVVFVGIDGPGGYSVCGYDLLASFVINISKNIITVDKSLGLPRDCTQNCVRVDTWSRTAISSMRIGTFKVDNGMIDTGLNTPLVIDSVLKYTGGNGAPPVDCGNEHYVQRNLSIGEVDLGPTPACYATFDDSSYQAIVGAGLLLRHDLTIDLGRGTIWFGN